MLATRWIMSSAESVIPLIRRYGEQALETRQGHHPGSPITESKMRGERARGNKRPEDPEGDESGIRLRRAGGWRLGEIRRSGRTNGMGDAQGKQ